MALVQTTMETTMALDTTMALAQTTMETTMAPVTTLGTVQITRSNTYVRCTCTFDYVSDYLGLTQQNTAISRKNVFFFIFNFRFDLRDIEFDLTDSGRKYSAFQESKWLNDT